MNNSCLTILTISRIENILQATLGQAELEEPAQSRIEELLIELKELIESSGGGSGGVTNYDLLSNKPVINGVILQGSKDLTELGIASSDSITSLGSLAYANEVTASYTPSGSIDATNLKFTSTKKSGYLVQSLGTLPTYDVTDEVLTLSKGTLPSFSNNQFTYISDGSITGMSDIKFTGNQTTITSK